MFIQLEALIGGYLDTTHPSVAATLRSEAKLSTAAEATPPCNTAALKGFLDWAIRTVSPQRASATPQSATARTTGRAHAAALCSSDDGAPEERRARGKETRSGAKTETAAAARVAHEESAPKTRPSGLPAAPDDRKPHHDSDAEEDEDRAEQPQEQVRRPPHAAQSRKRGPANLQEDGTYRRFQRIDPTRVSFHADALRDNGPAEEHLTLRQNQEMMRVKGKSFNKLKQKNKGKFYGAGVDLTVRAYQFPDSDEE